MDIQLSVKQPKCLGSISTWKSESLVGVDTLSCIYDLDSASIADFRESDLVLPDALTSAVFSRQIEYLAGRYLAKVLLTNNHASSTILARGENRQPIWPRGFVGSISHAGNRAVCVLGNSARFESLGVDIENYIDDQTVDEISSMTNLPQEQGLLTHLSESVSQTLIFSAKESIFKALFPLVNCYFDFKDVEITHIDLASEQFHAELKIDLSERITAGRSIQGRFFLDDDQLSTFVVLPKGEC